MIVIIYLNAEKMQTAFANVKSLFAPKLAFAPVVA